MGSKSDWETMRHTDDMLNFFGVAHECRVVSAHRTPEYMSAYAREAEERGIEVIIAGAINAALLAVAILANHDPELRSKLRAFREEQTAKVRREILP